MSIGSEKQPRRSRVFKKASFEPDNEIKFINEDGWVFREQPGKSVECVQRSETPSQPNLVRHDYPST